MAIIDTQTLPGDPRRRAVGLAALFVVYFVYGTTYLAMRVAVGRESGFPPFTLGFCRLLVPGLILLGIEAMRGRKVLLPRRDLVNLAGSGILLWVGGQGSALYALQRADSGFAALMYGAIPIWTAIFDSALNRKAPSLLLAGSILIGFGGLAVLNLPGLQGASGPGFLTLLALVTGPIAWSAGSVFQSRHPVQTTPLTAAGWQIVFSGIAFGVIALAIREPVPRPDFPAWMGWLYLVVVGSLIAFPCFVTALRNLPINIVMTYPFVNPIIAVIAGSILLNESITIWTVAGGTLLIAGVAGVFDERYGKRKPV